MAFKYKGQEVLNVTINGTPISQFSLGGRVVWTRGTPPPVEKIYLVTEDGDYLVTENNERLEV